jgi:hypothetical protein
VARFSVQVALQYEIDAREMPANFSTGYFPEGATSPDDDWGYVYNTEVFAVNSALRDLAFDMIDAGKLHDLPDAIAYRANYAKDPAYAAGAANKPAKVKCDVATTDVWWSGALLGDAFEKRMKIWTNGSSVYCTTAQEDGAVLAAMLRGQLAGKVDYGRSMVMRTSSLQESLVKADTDSRLTRSQSLTSTDLIPTRLSSTTWSSRILGPTSLPLTTSTLLASPLLTTSSATGTSSSAKVSLRRSTMAIYGERLAARLILVLAGNLAALLSRYRRTRLQEALRRRGACEDAGLVEAKTTG